MWWRMRNCRLGKGEEGARDGKGGEDSGSY